ncbi:MAG: IS1634 family transposase, partial [Halobacteriota archaeon]|nr:IS1634 family transposase [Halobacteriota archaeon]
EVYLKKEERIEALAMVMVLCLLIYSIAEWKLRDRLKETCENVPDQKGKPIVRPTMKWVFYHFRGVSEVVVKIGNKVNCEVANMKEVLMKILSLLGPEVEKYYG